MYVRGAWDGTLYLDPATGAEQGRRGSHEGAYNLLFELHSSLLLEDTGKGILAFVALGSNVGDRAAYLAFAREHIAALPGTRILAVSDVEETAPIGPVPQDSYFNQMLRLETSLPPAALLRELEAIERAAGRTRDLRWGPRTLDLDIVLYERQTAHEPGLRVPHWILLEF